jgi:hypothetical protein
MEADKMTGQNHACNKTAIATGGGGQNPPSLFCQLEAVETIIYLNEVLGSGRRYENPSCDRIIKPL